MRRRTVLTSLGVLAAGGAVGSGAFTTAEAERTVDVAIADEDEALLALEPESDFAIASTERRKRIRLDFDQIDDDRGEGLGSRSRYLFDGVFRVSNQGTQTLYLESDIQHDNEDFEDHVEVDFYVDTKDDKPLDGENEDGAVLKISSGSSALIGTEISVSNESEPGVEDPPDTAVQEFSMTATITTADEEPDEVTVLETDDE